MGTLGGTLSNSPTPCHTPSPRSATRAHLKAILEQSLTAGDLVEPYAVDVEKLLHHKAWKAYTPGSASVRQSKIRFFLDFMASEHVDICPSDNAKAITNWGSPKQARLVKLVASFAQTMAFDSTISPVTHWGKTVSRLYTIFATIVWPRSAPDIVQQYRCCAGIRINVTSEDHNTEADLQNSNDSKSPMQGKTTESRLSFRTPSPRTSSRSKKTFSPFFDILENGSTYVVRIILPLMDPLQAKRIKFESNFTQKCLRVSGSYIPGCHIGDTLTREFSISAPLRPSIPAPSHNCGWFDLKIPLPSDIKDDACELNVSQVMWGLAVHLPRRKRMGEVAVQLSTCFGTANLGVEDTAIQTIIEPDHKIDTDEAYHTESANNMCSSETDVTADLHKGTQQNKDRALPSSNITQPRRRSKRKRAATVTPKVTTPKVMPSPKRKKMTKRDLLGRRVSFPGEMWHQDYAGQTYTGVITKIYRSGEAKDETIDVFQVKIDGEVHGEVFYLSDLLTMGCITQAEHDAVKDPFDY